MNKNLEHFYKKIYFIGIGGISMSGLAEILKNRGVFVCGSDMKHSDTTDHLVSLGIPVFIGHKKENISDDIDLVIYTAAVKEDNPELLAAKEKKIKIIDRAELLGKIMAGYEKSIAVAGTHGKTTTTSMVSEILLHANADPTISVGGILPSIGGNTKIGNSNYFVAEACEYFDSFLKFNPFIGIILNMEADHLDYFKDFSHIQNSFHSFAHKIPKEGTLIIHSKIKDLDKIIKDLDCNVLTIGLKNDTADWKAENIIHEENGKNSFDAVYQGESKGRIHLHIPGEHNITNALCACAAAFTLGIDMQYIIEGLDNYKGTARRFQYKGTKNGFTVIDDYAHHPTEIKATLEAASKVKHHHIWCVFQPHTYSRTYNFLNEFGDAFQNADTIILTDIYAAREKDTGLIHSKDLLEKIKSHGKNVIYIKEFDSIKQYILDHCQKDDLIITMGAGDVYLIGESILKF